MTMVARCSNLVDLGEAPAWIRLPTGAALETEDHRDLY
jgi:hypothetical protein